MNMGSIYLISGPGGQGYVGQTIATIQLRWRRHVAKAYREHQGATKNHKLSAAIREYGENAFTVMECWSCPVDELDEWETMFIEVFDTFGPNGYNGNLGGHQARYTGGPKKTHAGRTLPAGITYLTNKSTEGFRVRAYETGDVPIIEVDVEIISAGKTMDEKYEEALQVLEAIKSGEYYRRERARPRTTDTKRLPKYVYVDQPRDRVWVQKRKFPKKYFQDKSKPIEERIQQAAAYAAALSD